MYLTAAPFWLEKPADLVLAPEENGRLVCRSDGVPRPTISWFLNGEPIESKFGGSAVKNKSKIAQLLLYFPFFCVLLFFLAATPLPNRQVSGDTLTLRSVTIENNGVYQCNASNPFGYLLANAFVNVLRKLPLCYPWMFFTVLTQP